MSNIKSKIEAVLKTIEGDSRDNGLAAETVLAIYQAGRHAFQLAGAIPSAAAYRLHHPHPDAPEHAD